MRAVLIKKFGSINSHAIEELPEPAPGAGEVLLTVNAVAANFVDILVVTGKYQFLPKLPFSPGKLPAGAVNALGAGVHNLQVGDRVLALAEHGGYAQKICVDARQCFKLPPSMSFVDAASMALAYDTAWFALYDRARITPGDSVLVLGATGGVGLAAVQIAKAMNARVLAAVANLAKAGLARDAGADAIVDLSRDNLRDSLCEQVYAANDGKGVDIVIDPVGGDAFDAALRALDWRGRLIIIGFASGRIPTIKANYLLLKNIEVSGMQISDYRKRIPEMMARCLREIFDLFEQGKLKPPPTVTYPLDKFVQALRDIEERRVTGRIVLLPNP